VAPACVEIIDRAHLKPSNPGQFVVGMRLKI
jgi:hypothetical protein